ncbi:hypothetical protein SEA_Phreeze_89 [Mycobacterium phage Phreeze]|nr:hypothetical protein SEA_Phreeze_89 [Mycobacterium phage Phreeze]
MGLRRDVSLPAQALAVTYGRKRAKEDSWGKKILSKSWKQLS